MIDARQRAALRALLEGEPVELRWDEPMSRHSGFAAGGPVDLWLRVAAPGLPGRVLSWCRRERLPLLVCDGPTRRLVREGGLRGVLLELAGEEARRRWEEMGVEEGGSVQVDVAEAGEGGFGDGDGDGPGGGETLPQLPSARLFLDPRRGSDARILVADCGLAGLRIRGARVCPDRPERVENCGQASARDVLALFDCVRRRVLHERGVGLEMAPRVIGRDADPTRMLAGHT